MMTQSRATDAQQELLHAATELETILNQIEAKGFKSLDPADAERLPERIRNAASALASSRSSGMQEPQIAYFESLLHQAWLALRDAKRGYLRQQLSLWFQVVPGILWDARWLFLFSALLFLCGSYIGFEWVQGDVESVGRLFPAAIAEELTVLETSTYAQEALAARFEQPLLVFLSIHGRLLVFFGGYAVMALLSVYFGAALTPFLLVGAGASLGAFLGVLPDALRGTALLQLLPYVGMCLASMSLALAAGVRVAGSVFTHRQATRRADIAHRLQDGVILFYLALAHALLAPPMLWLSLETLASPGGRLTILCLWGLLAALYFGVLGGFSHLLTNSRLFSRRAS